MGEKRDNHHLIFLRLVCQNFLVHSDSGFAHRLQEEECKINCASIENYIFVSIVAAHFDRNRTHRRESQLGVKTARNVEQEEKQALAAKQRNFYEEKQKLFVNCSVNNTFPSIILNSREENDTLFAQKLQKHQSHSTNSSTYDTSDDQV